MNTLRQCRVFQTAVSILVTLCLLVAPVSYAADFVIPDGSTVYLTTLESVVGKKHETAIGDIVRTRVWRDVVVDGQIVIKGGTPATTRVSSITSRKIFGIKGKMSIAAVETSTVDGQTVYLTGGYNKEGKSRMGWSLGLGLLVVWPALFIPGKAAELPAGTVMDSFTSGSVAVSIAGDVKPARKVSLGALMTGMSVEILYDKLLEEEKPKNFDFMITTEYDVPLEFVVDVVNNEEIDPIELNVSHSIDDEAEDEKVVYANVEIKTLAKQFKKGINTFEISYDDGGERVSHEVILDIEM